MKYTQWDDPQGKLLATQSVFTIVLSFVLSLLLHRFFYSETRPRFTQTRIAPAIGVVLIVLVNSTKRPILRKIFGLNEANPHQDSGNAVLDLLSALWSAAEVGVGVVVADASRQMYEEVFS